MSEEFTVNITGQAREQMREIARYLAVTLQEPDTARHLLNKLEEKIASLVQFPARIALTEEEPWHSHGIHKMPVKNYLVYFWIDEAAEKVQVTAVLYGKRDQMNRLSELNMES